MPIAKGELNCVTSNYFPASNGYSRKIFLIATSYPVSSEISFPFILCAGGFFT